MKIKERIFSGTTNPAVREYETRHRVAAREAADEGIVLLKNEDHLLPLAKGSKVALYGAGAVKTIKGGTGSGDVNAREIVSVWQGMKDAGFVITNEDWLNAYETEYAQARLDWRQRIWDKADSMGIAPGQGLFYAYTSIPFLAPVGREATATDADTAIYVISRTAGEAADRFDRSGDYQLTAEEEKAITEVCSLYSKVVLVLNVGGIMDLSVLDRHAEIKSVVLLHQAGMEAGHAFADVVSGDVTPSGKLTDTWAYHYADYPNSASFSHNNGNVMKEEYTEGLFVGYRYFDTFDIPVRYGFGFGLSYANFTQKLLAVSCEKAETLDTRVSVQIKVANTSENFSGKEVVQVYAACPQDGIEKEYRRLVGFAKTKLLAPKEEQIVTVSFSLRDLTSFDEETSGWVLETGAYGLFVGNSLANSSCEAVLNLCGNKAILHTEHICPMQTTIEELHAGPSSLKQKTILWQTAAKEKPVCNVCLNSLVPETISYNAAYDVVSENAKAFVDSLTEEQLISLATGAVTKGQGGDNVGAAGITVPGSAAETSDCAKEQGLAEIVLADGPAGLRLIREYYKDNSAVQATPFDMAVEEGFLCRNQQKPVGTPYYQYCTAIPVGTMLAQTWNPEIVAACGTAVAEEMVEFGVTLWLAPGMSFHRNPLCGRNFEYYSEDPVLSGKMAAAMTNGVQAIHGCGTTIKHFACNNEEDNRTHSDSILSERTLREIYLKSFEIAIRDAAPMALMTSYNLINGIHTANSFDLCTKVLRNEWGFKGLVMTDWGTTEGGPDCTASGCMRAGNDVVMPGTLNDHQNIRAALRDGTLNIQDLKRSVGHLVETVWQSNRYE